MNTQGYSLPVDAPRQLAQLLKDWQTVALDHLPTADDFPFTELAAQRPGVFISSPLIKPGRTKAHDLKFEHVGSAHADRPEAIGEGVLYSKVFHARMFPRVLQVYNEVRESGMPHYWEMTTVLYGATRVVPFSRLLLPLYTAKKEFDRFLADVVWADDD